MSYQNYIRVTLPKIPLPKNFVGPNIKICLNDDSIKIMERIDEYMYCQFEHGLSVSQEDVDNIVNMSQN